MYRCPFRLILLLSFVPSLGCTVIQWGDSHGSQHHFGLLFYRIEDLEQGRQVERFSFGSDLRLSGCDRGYSLGLKMIEAKRPTVVFVDEVEELTELYLSSLRKGCSKYEPSRKRHVRWGVLHLIEDISTQATIVASSVYGLDLRVGPLSPGLSVGYMAAKQLAGGVFEDGSVQLHLQESGAPCHDRLILWKLRTVNKTSGGLYESMR